MRLIVNFLPRFSHPCQAIYFHKYQAMGKLLLLLRSFVALSNDFSFATPGLKYSKSLNARNVSITGSPKDKA